MAPTRATGSCSTATASARPGVAMAPGSQAAGYAGPLRADPLGRPRLRFVALAVTLGVHRDHRHRARVAISHHVSGRGGVFLEMLSVAMGGERGLVVVHLEEEHVVWTIGHHEDIELAAARLLDGISGVLLDRLDILRHFGRNDDEIDRVDID